MCDRFLVQAGVTELAFAESREKRPLERYTQVHWVGPCMADLAGKGKRAAPVHTALAGRHGVLDGAAKHA